jgi:hypothetical protein
MAGSNTCGPKRSPQSAPTAVAQWFRARELWRGDLGQIRPARYSRNRPESDPLKTSNAPFEIRLELRCEPALGGRTWRHDPALWRWGQELDGPEKQNQEIPELGVRQQRRAAVLGGWRGRRDCALWRQGQDLGAPKRRNKRGVSAAFGSNCASHRFNQIVQTDEKPVENLPLPCQETVRSRHEARLRPGRSPHPLGAHRAGSLKSVFHVLEVTLRIPVDIAEIGLQSLNVSGFCQSNDLTVLAN